MLRVVRVTEDAVLHAVNAAEGDVLERTYTRRRLQLHASMIKGYAPLRHAAAGSDEKGKGDTVQDDQTQAAPSALEESDRASDPPPRDPYARRWEQVQTLFVNQVLRAWGVEGG